MRKKSLLGRIADAVATEVKDTVSDKIGLAPNFYVCQFSTGYHQDNIKSLMKPSRAWHVSPEKLNKDMRMRKIFKYSQYSGSASLVPEHTNEYDENAVRVIANGVMIGYIYSDDLPKIHNLIKAGCTASVRIYGGPYKVVSLNNDAIETDANFGAELTVVKNQ